MGRHFHQNNQSEFSNWLFHVHLVCAHLAPHTLRTWSIQFENSTFNTYNMYVEQSSWIECSIYILYGRAHVYRSHVPNLRGTNNSDFRIDLCSTYALYGHTHIQQVSRTQPTWNNQFGFSNWLSHVGYGTIRTSRRVLNLISIELFKKKKKNSHFFLAVASNESNLPKPPCLRPWREWLRVGPLPNPDSARPTGHPPRSP
jgi:hypothetical protein